MEINCSKTQTTLLSLSTVKEKVMLKLKDMPVPQVDNPTFLGVTLDTRLTWKSHLKAVSARSARKLELAGTTWGADTNILRGSTLEQSVPSWSMPQPPGPLLQMPTGASWTRSKMSHHEPFLVP